MTRTTPQHHGTDVVADAPGQLRLTCVRVGMGDCTIVVLPDEQVVVIDCGSSARAGATADQIRSHLPVDIADDPRPIDLLVLTHADKDHINLIRDVIGRTRVERVRHSAAAATYTNGPFARWRFVDGNIGPMTRVDVNAADPDEELLIAGGALDSGGEIQLVAVAASVASAYVAPAMIKNTGSVVVVCRRVTDGGFENLFLIAADATCETERFMLAADRAPRIAGSYVMRVGHHGSDTSSSAPFIAAVDPRAAVVSSAQHRRYGLPKQSVVDRWMGVMPAGEDLREVGFYLDGDGVMCRGNNQPDLDLEDWGLEDLGLAWGEVETLTEMYETMAGSRTWTWT